MTEALAPSEGWGVLHLFCKPRPGADAQAVSSAVKAASEGEHQVVPVAILGHKADLGFLAIGPDLWRLRQLQSDLQAAGLDIVDSYVSLTEMSEYSANVPEAQKQARLYPKLPFEGMNAFCFYPMSKRREVGQNWFALPYEERLGLIDSALPALSDETRATLRGLEPSRWTVVRTEARRVLDATERTELRDTAVAETRARLGAQMAGGLVEAERMLATELIAPFVAPNSSFSEDLTAQAFLRAMEAMPRYEDRGVPFVAWLLRITANLAINYRKAQKNGRHAQLPETLEDDDARTSPETCCTMKSEGDHVWQKVRTLPLEQRQVIVMRFMDDLPYSTVAQVLGKSVGAVRVIQFRALSNLRNILRDDELAAAYQHARAS